MECILESSESSGSSSSLPTSSNNSKQLSEPESDTNTQNGQTHTYLIHFFYKITIAFIATLKNVKKQIYDYENSPNITRIKLQKLHK